MNADAADEHRYSYINTVSYAIIGAAQRVSSALGVGFLEKVYENALVWELRKARLEVASQVAYDVLYDGHPVGTYIPDLVVANRVIVEIKAIPSLDSSIKAQCINYLKVTDFPLCLLLNFGRPRLEFLRFVLTR